MADDISRILQLAGLQPLNEAQIYSDYARNDPWYPSDGLDHKWQVTVNGEIKYNGWSERFAKNSYSEWLARARSGDGPEGVAQATVVLTKDDEVIMSHDPIRYKFRDRLARRSDRPFSI